MSDKFAPFEPTDVGPFIAVLDRMAADFTEAHYAAMARFDFIEDGGDPEEIEAIERWLGL